MIADEKPECYFEKRNYIGYVRPALNTENVTGLYLMIRGPLDF